MEEVVLVEVTDRGVPGGGGSMERSGEGQLPFSIRVDREGDKVFIALFGDFNLSYQGEFEEALSELDRERVTSVVVDLSGLTFMDSTGLFLLLNLWKRSHGEETSIVFEGGSEEIQNLFEATGVDHVLPVASSGRSPTSPTNGRGTSSQLS